MCEFWTQVDVVSDKLMWARKGMPRLAYSTHSVLAANWHCYLKRILDISGIKGVLLAVLIVTSSL